MGAGFRCEIDGAELFYLWNYWTFGKQFPEPRSEKVKACGDLQAPPECLARLAAFQSFQRKLPNNEFSCFKRKRLASVSSYLLAHSTRTYNHHALFGQTAKLYLLRQPITAAGLLSSASLWLGQHDRKLTFPPVTNHRAEPEKLLRKSTTVMMSEVESIKGKRLYNSVPFKLLSWSSVARKINGVTHWENREPEAKNFLQLCDIMNKIYKQLRPHFRHPLRHRSRLLWDDEIAVNTPAQGKLKQWSL